ncbi:lytic transglycosylase [Photobacterium proteolyticum]|uniref:Lytic transglycosylase n=1 Tax=Photobacterium proteolyticum TaxID=1903952 RepID=A0A1Q9GXA0_9GAMM|nr:murein transglycosylase [Photobacterium proteolyticum]OLQ79873.1 lytic transglycosylase [Photobacterium proteolyticum]
MIGYFLRKAFSVVIITAGIVAVPTSLAADLEQQRDWYEQAGIALEEDNIDEYRKLRDKLDDYPLTPYLDYRDFSRLLFMKTPKQVEDFIEEYKNLPFSTTIKSRYLEYLAGTKRWQNFVEVQPMPPRGEVLKCHYYYAQSKLGNTEVAWQGAESLWLTGKSLSDACDPLLNKWQKAGQRTNTLILDRMLLVYEEGHRNRLKYLNKQLSGSGKAKGREVLALYDDPDGVAAFSKRSKVTPFNQSLTVLAYKRLVRKDVREAVKQYQRTMDGQHYSKAKRQLLADYTASRLFSTDDEALLRWRDDKVATSNSTNLLERRIRVAIRKADWKEAGLWIDRLSEADKASTRWTFWRAKLQAKAGNEAAAEELYRSILGQRDFYSAAAATVLNKPVVYPVKNPNQSMSLTYEYGKTLRRIKELIALDKIFAADREWHYLLDHMNNDEVVMLATYAAANKWHHFAVQATISGQLWDYVELRFPIAHKWWFDFFSKKRDLPATTMMALARQESALNVEAVSPVGARGLMQLMPGTAKETAQKLGRNYKGKKSLFDPGVNIRLGSGYLKMMLERYDNNRIFAFAAYNAGPSRVKRWRQETDEQLDVFEFIEAIPFTETRGYVQNILMFEVYYGDLTGDKNPLLKPNELEAMY